MKTSTQLITISFSLLFFSQLLFAGSNEDQEENKGFRWDTIAIVKTTSVKDQHRSGTCWSFAATSFVETELLRLGHDEMDLAEMFFVRYAYLDKAEKYVRYHGKTNFSMGGQAHDVINVIKDQGLITEKAYPGLETGEDKHNHGEMDAVLSSVVKAIIKKRGGKITPVWKDAYGCILDSYLGTVPESFNYNGENFTPEAFANHLEFVPDDYVELTSYEHIPFYQPAILELPDNWSMDKYYNIPLDELMEVMEYALTNNYSVCWDGDVSDKGFSHKNGLAIAPIEEKENLEGTEQSRWEDLSEEELEDELYSFKQPVPEKSVTQKHRQVAFDNYSATDDHLMHLTGIVEDQEGTKYFITKNSWDTDSNEFGGYLNMSSSYLRLHTIAIMVHKDAIPERIAKKLNL